MQTKLAEFIKDTAAGREAEAILRKCVHCGFCTATCPTYQLLGDELDGPRGRIYLIKQVLEGAQPTDKTRTHLDRCLTCRACETTCPSGVQYARLADIGRAVVEMKTRRPLAERLRRGAIRHGIAEPALFDPLLKLGQALAPALPKSLRQAIPETREQTSWASVRHERRMLVLDGCVQPSLAPNINAAASRVLDALGIALVRESAAGCCGALDFHMNAQAQARARMRRLIDAWWHRIDGGIEAIVFTASGCGVMLKDYAHALADDPAYRAKAERISRLCKDLSEVVCAERDRLLALARTEATMPRIAFHAPCTLQHGLRLGPNIEGVLRDLGCRLVPVPDAHLCCGSAGTYSILQPELARRLKAKKQAALTSGRPEEILTANIGCLAHLQSGIDTPVRHWIEWVADRIGRPR
ncbi:MAG: glycolate oxidase subunit GlcF [Burkholderiales bacterium]|nr:glycolate oxidase subunit GlcF [Burkholderiales bacterium]